MEPTARSVRRASAQPTSSRVVFADEFLHAIRVRGLTLQEVARRARVSPATVASAVRGRPVNVSTAVCLSRAVAAVPVIEELEGWATGTVSAQLAPPTEAAGQTRRNLSLASPENAA